MLGRAFDEALTSLEPEVGFWKACKVNKFSSARLWRAPDMGLTVAQIVAHAAQ